jgi:hypothetical protein
MMNDRKRHLKSYPKGVSGNPGGKPIGSRNKLQGTFWRALAEDFEAHGVRAIRQARENDPMGYIKTVASLMPRQLEQSSPLNDLTDVELNAGIEYLRTKLSIASIGERAGEEKFTQPALELQAVSEANGISCSGPRLPGAAVNGGQPAGENSSGGHGDGHASDRGVP